MKIYVEQNDQKLGPYTTEEARNLVYSGGILRSARACPEAGGEWVPLAALLDPPAPPPNVSVPPPIGFSLDKLRDPSEKKALICLYVAAAFGVLFLFLFLLLLQVLILVWLMMLVGELWFA